MPDWLPPAWACIPFVMMVAYAVVAFLWFRREGARLDKKYPPPTS